MCVSTCSTACDHGNDALDGEELGAVHDGSVHVEDTKQGSN